MVYYRIQEIVQTVALRDVDWFWLGAVALGQHLAVFDLQGSENVLSEELLLFDIEVADHYSDEQIQGEKAADNHENDKEYLVGRLVACHRHQVHIS